MAIEGPSELTILDYIDEISVPGDVFSKPANEYWALACLREGLRFLNRQVAKCEENVGHRYNSQIKLVAFGSDPLFTGIPQTLLTCAFDWYAISACQYVRTVGTIAYQQDDTRPDPVSYVRTVIPEVLAFRNKVAAHFAWTMKNKRDNRAERKVSVMPQLTFQDGHFFVGSWKLHDRSSGETSTSEHIKPWSVTTVHERMCKRYWPSEIAQKY